LAPKEFLAQNAHYQFILPIRHLIFPTWFLSADGSTIAASPLDGAISFWNFDFTFRTMLNALLRRLLEGDFASSGQLKELGSNPTIQPFSAAGTPSRTGSGHSDALQAAAAHGYREPFAFCIRPSRHGL
jgi:hypothetical protein